MLATLILTVKVKNAYIEQQWKFPEKIYNAEILKQSQRRQDELDTCLYLE